jgi:hypothetical protein
MTVSGLTAGQRPVNAINEAIVSVVLVALSLWILARLNDLLFVYFSRYGESKALVWLPFLACVAFASCFSSVRYATFIPLMRLALRSSAIGLLAYLLLEPPDLTLANPNAFGAAEYVRLSYAGAILFAALSVSRPAFVIPVAIYISSTRLLVEEISNLQMSTLDIRYMLDMALYLSLFGAVGLTIGRLIQPNFSDERRQQEITYVGFGLHLGNYFWSGVAKLMIGPHLWTWILENQTSNTIPYAIVNGTLPIGHLPWLVQPVYDFVHVIVQPLNLAIVGFQLFAIVCPLRLAWLKLATLFYDLLHIGIWILGGLFFWPWVWNNVTILVAANAQRSPIKPTAKAACILTILLGMPSVPLYPSLPFYKAAGLGWFDVADARQTYFEAITNDGRRARVPSSFFLSHSYSVSHGQMDTVPHVGHYSHTWWGSAHDYGRLLSSGKCLTPEVVPADTLERAEQRTERLNKVGQFIRAHHAKMLHWQSWLGSRGYYFSRLYHHPSNPLLFGAFNALNLGDVVAYNLVVESVCNRLVSGSPETTVIMRTEARFNVTP